MNFPKLVDATLDRQGNTAVLTFNRDDVRNVLTGTGLIDDIENAVNWLNQQDDIQVLVVTGAGKAFSAGGNLKEMAGRASTHADGPYSGTPAEVESRYRHGIQRIPRAMSELKIPSIAAVNGAAIGAGFDLALMCDLRLASTEAKMGETFISLGLISGVGGAYWLTRALGPQLAAELSLTGRVLTATEALDKGILLSVTEPEQLVPQALELAAQMANKPPQTLRWTKQLLQQAQFQTLDDHLKLCAQLQGHCHNQDDHLEAVNAFLEKRSPSFKGC